ncbi:Gfo/Idh/MocA family oxidoreductase [Martelella sp. HB161492]|uniref:Gfo/Idh/MocA family protein n=1 Tax=Martelella sp. HB161492 TaxID=2720726 RepID=UPI001592981E|nr:Gfo/Idh/MocA family oxidoreductase [Martelella sp. HB161492]
MTRKLKVGIVGLGFGRTHIETGYRTNEALFEVVAICDRNEAQRDVCGDEFGIERRVGKFEELLAMDDIDIIDICTPPGTHYDMILSALAHGKHVICEKPLVASLSAMDDIMEAESRSTGRVLPIMQYRFGHGVQKAKRIVEAGLAGKAYVATAETHWLRGADYYAKEWRGRWETAVGGTLLTHAIHINDLLFYLLGPARSLFARIATRVNRIEVEDCASISLEMKCGALATISATTGSQEQISRLRFCFENVTFESAHLSYHPGGDPWKIIPSTPEAGAKIDALLADFDPGPERLSGLMAAYHEAICQKKQLPVTLADARQALDLATASYWSAKTYSAVALPVMADHPFYHGWQNAL